MRLLVVFAALALTILALYLFYSVFAGLLLSLSLAGWGLGSLAGAKVAVTSILAAIGLIGLWMLRRWLMRGVRDRISEDGGPSRNDVYALFFARWSLRLGAVYVALFGGGLGLYYQMLYVSWGGPINFSSVLVICAAAAAIWWSSTAFRAHDASQVSGKERLMNVIAKNKKSRQRRGEILPADARPNERV